MSRFVQARADLFRRPKIRAVLGIANAGRTTILSSTIAPGEIIEIYGAGWFCVSGTSRVNDHPACPNPKPPKSRNPPVPSGETAESALV